MARLQILGLPEGAGDDRPPFVLVVDQVPTDEAGFDAIRRDLGTPEDLIERIGARAVLVFEEAIDILANAATPIAADDAERPTTAQIIDAHERTRLDLCDALQLPQDTTWRNLVNHARGARNGRDVRAAALERLRNLPTRPEIMDAQHEQPQGYLHGYSVAIGDAQRAARTPVDEDGY